MEANCEILFMQREKKTQKYRELRGELSQFLNFEDGSKYNHNVQVTQHAHAI